MSGSGGYVGGLVGENFAAISAISESYWNTETSGQSSSEGGSGLTSAEMRRVASFGGFDFTDTWQIDEYLSFPTLQDNPQDPAPGFAFTVGDGTSGTPYEITTSAQLDAIRGDLDAHYILTEDIELSTATGSGGVFYHGGAGWEPIGENGDEFTGSLDGNGHTITGLYIDRSGDDYVGLFGSLGSGSSVSDLGVEEADVTGDRHVGILVGETDGSITGSYATGEVSGNNRVGGLVGITSSSGSSITGSYSGASVSGGDRVGGLVGYSYGSISESYATASVSGSGGYVGGLVGENFGAISESYASASVSGSGSYVGGLVGFNQPSGTVTDSYATGLVGGTSLFGGLVGRNIGSVFESYWNRETSGQEGGIGLGSGDVTGLNSAGMRRVASFAGFDFGGTWQIEEYLGFPVLQANPQDPPPGDVPASAASAAVGGGTAGQATTVTVTLRDAAGDPATGSGGALALSVAGANAGASFGAPVDNGDGTYAASYTPTVAGTDEIAITLGGVAIPGSPFSSTVTAGPPASVTLSGPASTVAGQVAGPFTLELLDTEGNATTAGGLTGFGLTSTGTTFYADAAGQTEIGELTLAGGASTGLFYYASPSAGEHAITADWSSGPDGDLGQATHDITVTAGTAGALVFAGQPSGAVAGQVWAPAPSVRIEDDSGNLVSGSAAEVTLTLSGGPAGAILSGTLTVAAESGVATFGDLSVAAAGEGYTLAASADGLAGASSTSFEITAGPPASVTLSGPASAVAGQVAGPFTLGLLDTEGNATTAGGLTGFGLTSTGTTFYADAAGQTEIGELTLAGGASTGPFYYASPSAGEHAITADWSSGPDGDLGQATHDITVTAGTAGALVFAGQPSGAVAGQVWAPAPSVRIEDDSGNLVSGSAAEVTLTLSGGPAGAILSGTLTVAAESGVATFGDLSIAAAGEGYTLAASADGLTGASTTSFDITAGLADAGASSAEVPAEGLRGTPTTLTVTLRDAAGNLVAGEPGQLAAAVVSGPNSGAAFSKVTGHGDGTYTLSYTPKQAGADQLAVTVRGEAVDGSPFPHQVAWEVDPPGAPGVPAPTPGDRRVALAWSAPASGGGAPVTGYRVQVSSNAGSGWSEAGGTLAGTSRTVRGLDNQRGYRFRVAAVNAVGPGPWSPPSAVAVPTAPPPDPGGPGGSPPPPGDATGTLDGEPIELTLQVTDDGELLLTDATGTFRLTLAALGLTGDRLPVSSLDQILRLLAAQGASVRISGDGFAPGSWVTVWLFSEPLLLGKLEVGAGGTMGGDLPLPAQIPVGAHTLLVSGLSPSGALRTVSAGVEAAHLAPPSLLAPPSIAGEALEIGAELAADPGTWGGEPAPALTPQWMRCPDDQTTAACVPIAGATGAQYLLASADLGSHLRVRVVADNGIFAADTAWSAPTASAVTPGAGVASGSRAEVPAGVAGEPTTVRVTLRDAHGTAVDGAAGYLALSVASGPNAGAPFGEVAAHGDGVYSAAYTPARPGTDRIEVMLSGMPVDQGIYASQVGPLKNELLPNYPNPFAGPTSIAYAVVAPARVTLQVYDVLGRVVRTLADIERQSPGEHVVEWAPERLAGGVYYYRLVIVPEGGGEPFTKTLPMTYIR
ncbi:MAG: filamin/ABP280 repeat domain-containing protein [Balneolaceae bacterium]|nr:filamin/ABP280 repeat domain-containing protein [Balneolaceae bacterium]